jgi:superfamily II DNA or RNA helicase
MTVKTISRLETLQECVRFLAGRCDGAATLDSVGFNAADTRYGKTLALVNCGDWNLADEIEAYDMLRKYKVQLSSAGIDFDAIAAPTEADRYEGQGYAPMSTDILRKYEERASRKVDFDGKTFVVSFKYDADLVALVKQFPSRRFDSVKKNWAVANSADNVAMMRRLQSSGFVLSEAAQNAFDTLCTTGSAPVESSAKDVTAFADFDGSSQFIDFDGNTFVIKFNYSADLVALVKNIFPSRKWNPGSKCWTVDNIVENLPGLVQLEDAGFVKSEAANAQVLVLTKEVAARTENVEASKAADAEIEVEGLGGTLRPFQKAGVAYAVKRERTFIADEMGLGKTVQALATIHKAQAYPAIVVCPASLKLNWKRETEKWLPGRTVSVWNGTPGADADVVIVNYDVLRKHAALLIRLNAQAIVFDESHYVKNRKAQRTQAALEIAKSCRIRLALTGTPVLNRPNELVTQLEVIGRLQDFGGWYKFVQQYCNAHSTRYGWDVGGARNLDQLNDKLRSICFVRRKKEDVLTELPPKMRNTVEVSITNRAEYNKAVDDLLDYLRSAAFVQYVNENADEDEDFSTLIEEADRAATQKANAARAAMHLVKINTLKQLAAAGKLEAAFEWIDNFVESGEKLVIFAHHKHIVRSIAERYNADFISGDVPISARQAAVDKFQNDSSAQIIVLNLQAGGVGITLTASSNVLFIEQPWSPGVVDQAEDRCHRIGQTDSVTAWTMLGEQTIDSEIYELIQAKRAVVDAATDGKAGAKKVSIMNDLVKLYKERAQS